MEGYKGVTDRYLDEYGLSRRVDPAECVASITAHETPPNWSSVIGHEHEPGVLRFRNVGKEIEPGVVVDETALWVTLLRSDVIGTHEWVANEEDRPVETDEIVVACNKINMRGEAFVI